VESLFTIAAIRNACVAKRSGRKRRARLLTLTALVTILSGPEVWADPGCALKPFRWDEDCSNLRGQAGPPSGLERLRYIALTDSGSVWLTLGGEYRFKTEYFNAPAFALQPVYERYTAVGERFLLHADLRTAAGFRVFVQLSAATEAGRKPVYYPFDRSRPDIAQAFLDLPLLDGTVLRVGRQELDARGNRLISVREGANLRLAFDMAHLESHFAGFDAVAFYGRPVLNKPGAFDDRGNPAEKFWGGWLQRPLDTTAGAPLISVFFFSRERDHAVYQQGVASDDRRTAGLRVSGTNPGWDYAAEASYQYGSFGTDDIAAHGAAGDIGWHPAMPGHPRIAAAFGYASGDSNPHDHTLGTFDVLYPNLGYFTDAPVFYPGNNADVQPNITVEVLRAVHLRAGSDVIYRISKRDAVYTAPGVPLIRGDGAGSSYVTALSYLRADWTPAPGVSLTLSYVHGDAGSLIRSSGGHPFDYLAFWLDLRL
jgi:hypothetical protein